MCPNDMNTHQTDQGLHKFIFLVLTNFQRKREDLDQTVLCIVEHSLI